MEQSLEKRSLDQKIRHFVYTAFAETSRPPTTREVADHFKVSISAVEDAFERLAQAHHIALAPGSHVIWMAHPFSGLPTNYVTEVGKKGTGATESGISSELPLYSVKIPWGTPRAGVENAVRNWIWIFDWCKP